MLPVLFLDYSKSEMFNWLEIILNNTQFLQID